MISKYSKFRKEDRFRYTVLLFTSHEWNIHRLPVYHGKDMYSLKPHRSVLLNIWTTFTSKVNFSNRLFTVIVMHAFYSTVGVLYLSRQTCNTKYMNDLHVKVDIYIKEYFQSRKPSFVMNYLIMHECCQAIMTPERTDTYAFFFFFQLSN